MIQCDGYKMFHGVVTITPAVLPDGTRWREPFEMEGNWLFRPDTRCWYVQPDNGGFSMSFVPEILSGFRETP